MIRDLRDDQPEELPDYDVLIVGTGPAGATLANELRESGLRIGILESGKLRPSAHGDALRRVESEGIRIKDYSRERVLGGASTTWAGLSSPLDEIDFVTRPFVPHSGWPIARRELDPLYEAAAARYRFPPLDFFRVGGSEPGGFGGLRTKGQLAPHWKTIDEKVFLAASEPQNFGRELRALFDSPAVDVWLDATLLALQGETGGCRARVAVVRASSGREWRVRARVFVLATGGLENARLLLNSREPWSNGLGNEADCVGRYLMNHPKNYAGVLHLTPPVESAPYYFGCLYRGYAGYAGLRLDPATQRERRLLNSYVRLEPLFPWSDNPGVESLVALVKQSFVLRLFKRQRAGELVELRDYSETGDDSELQNARRGTAGTLALALAVVRHAPSVAQYAYFRVFRRAKPKVRRARLRNFMEMEPDPGNRVTLGDERDANGMRIARVQHAASELDRRSLLALHEVLAREIAESGAGRLETDLATRDPWPIDQDASHHMGTTRMGSDPRTSVVDAQLRVHQVENVYLAGASVFPTSGCANPTFTIVALSIRLARHLRDVLAAKSATGARP
ncbi:MAG: GMC oxidoreductase [Planctomycetota bacterium]